MEFSESKMKIIFWKNSCLREINFLSIFQILKFKTNFFDRLLHYQQKKTFCFNYVSANPGWGGCSVAKRVTGIGFDISNGVSKRACCSIYMAWIEVDEDYSQFCCQGCLVNWLKSDKTAARNLHKWFVFVLFELHLEEQTLLSLQNQQVRVSSWWIRDQPRLGVCFFPAPRNLSMLQMLPWDRSTGVAT